MRMWSAIVVTSKVIRMDEVNSENKLSTLVYLKTTDLNPN